jgi:hypothetical protein
VGRKVAALAEICDRPIAPHDCTGPVLLVASTHLVSATEKALILRRCARPIAATTKPWLPVCPGSSTASPARWTVRAPAPRCARSYAADQTWLFAAAQLGLTSFCVRRAWVARAAERSRRAEADRSVLCSIVRRDLLGHSSIRESLRIATAGLRA